MKVVPLFNRVYVVFNKVEEKKVAGIYVPDFHAEKVRTAVVQICGPDVKNVKAGDRICLSYDEGTVLDIDDLFDDTHRIISDTAILCKLED
jgi:co-chaperonin GroES (HSP10)